MYIYISVQFSLSVMSDSLRLHESQHTRPPLSVTNSRSLLKLMPIELVMPSSHLILCCPLLLLPPIPPCIRVFSNKSTLHMRWPKYWSFSFSNSPSNEHPGLISFICICIYMHMYICVYIYVYVYICNVYVYVIHIYVMHIYRYVI